MASLEVGRNRLERGPRRRFVFEVAPGHEPRVTTAVRAPVIASNAKDNPKQPSFDGRPMRVVTVPATMNDEKDVLRCVFERWLRYAQAPQVAPHECKVGRIEIARPCWGRLAAGFRRRGQAGRGASGKSHDAACQSIGRILTIPLRNHFGTEKRRIMVSRQLAHIRGRPAEPVTKVRVPFPA